MRYSQDVYKLSRDDGSNLQVNETVWEAALALAFANGWVPAGTKRAGRSAWNEQDYFSRRSQRVLGEDGMKLSSALLRGLPERERDPRTSSGAGNGAGAAPVLAARMTDRQRHLLQDVASFVASGAFTIA